MNNDNNTINNINYSAGAEDTPFNIGYDNSEEQAVADSGIFSNTEDVSKSQRLEKARNTKLHALTKLNNKANLDDSYTELDNGIIESNKNKIWNDLDDREIQSLHAFVQSNKALQRQEDGRTVDKDGNPFLGRTRRSYMFGTKVPDSDVVKAGLARGDIPDASARYIEELGGYASGDTGVDVARKYRDMLLPDAVATMLEAVDHGRTAALANRVVKDRYADPFTVDSLGGGSSEYYTSKEGLYGAPTEVDLDLGARLFEEHMNKLPAKYQNYALRKTQKSVPLSNADPLVNTLSGFGATFVNELFTKPLDAVGDLTGLYDLDKDGNAQKAVEDFFGYDNRAAEESIHKIGNYWDIAANSEATTSDRVRAAGNGMLEAFTTPEMLGTSFGALMAWVAPGALATKVFGVGSKFTNAARNVDELVAAGKLSAYAGKVKKAQEFMSIDGAKAFLASQAGFVTSSLGNVNKQYEEFVSNNNGQELEGEEKAKWFADRFAVQLLNQNLDKLVDFNVMKSPATIMALKPAFKAMTEKEFTNATLTMGKGFLTTLTSAGSEAAQEYAQTSMELFNSRFGSEKFKDLDTFTKFLSDPESIREAGIASLAGAGGSAQFEMVGAVTGVAGSASRNLVSKLVGTEDVNDPETAASAREVASVSEAQTVFASDSSNNSVAAYYAAQASNVSEVKSKASENANSIRSTLYDGSNDVFHSDKPTNIEDLSRLVEITSANNPEGDYKELKNVIIRNIAAKGENLSEEDSLKLDAADKKGKTFAAVKRMAEVSKEVTTGIGGFSTYYSAAKSAEYSGDTKAQAENTTKLEKFFYHATDKVARIQSKLTEVEGVVMAEAEALVRDGKASNINEALQIKGKEYGKNNNKSKGRVTVVKNSAKPDAKTTEISHYDVALSLRTRDSQQPFNGGIYSLLKTIKREVVGMHMAYNSLIGDASSNVGSTVDDITDLGDSVPVPTAEENTSISVSSEFSSRKFPEDVQKWMDDNKDNKPVSGWIKKVNDSIAKNGGISSEDLDRFSSKVRARIEKEAKEFSDIVQEALSVNHAEEGNDQQQTVDVTTSVGNSSTAADYQVTDADILEMLANASDGNTELQNTENLESFNDVITQKQENFTVPGDDIDAFNNAMLDFQDGEFDYENLESFNDTLETIDVDSLKSFNDTPVKEGFVQEDGTMSQKSDRKKLPQLKGVERFQEISKEIKEVKKAILERLNILKNTNKTTEEIEGDNTLRVLNLKKDDLEEMLDSLDSTTETHVADRISHIKNKDIKITLLRNWKGKTYSDIGYKVKSIFHKFKATGFTVQKEYEDSIHKETKAFGERLVAIVPQVTGAYTAGISNSLTGFILYTEDGEVNYNTVQAIHASVNDFILRNSENLFGANRDMKDIAKVLGIEEHEVTVEDIMALMNGGMSLKVSAAEIGKNALKHLGIKAETTAAHNALATHIGIAALEGYVDQNGQGLESRVLTRTRVGGSTTNIDIIAGTDDGKLLDRLKSISSANMSIEDRLKVKLDNSKSYRKTKKPKPRSVKLRNAEHLDAPKDHTETVNKLENTPFKFNSGNAILLEIFNKDGKLDKEALMDKIIGPKNIKRNKDDMDSYNAQRIALERSLDYYIEAVDDVGNAEIFFDWFIARNHRIHLDGTKVNPQGDKQIARWLITAVGSSVNINKDLVYAVVNGDHAGDYSHDVMVAKTFAYAIVQAFDGADGIPGIDKDPEAIILSKAKELLDGTYSKDDMYNMTKSSGLAHVGHAALAIANISKFNDSTNTDAEFTSDMVLEVDGLTNGFAFRAMQYPIGSEFYDVDEWLEKVGVIDAENSSIDDKGNPLANLESMNSARSVGLGDVYISTGKELGANVKTAKENMGRKTKKSEKAIAKDVQSLSWVDLFESENKLPDFTADLEGKTDKSKDLLKFVRNLMKGPVMIFGYSAGIPSIIAGLINDQVMGKGYLKGKGLITHLTSIDPKTGDYLVPKSKLVAIFGKDKGEVYHQARVDLGSTSILSNKNSAIVTLREDISDAVASLYTVPLKNTLNKLFSTQTAVNNALTQAGEFLFNHFEILYRNHIVSNPDITDEGKTEWLRDFAAIIPGIAGASSTDQKTKLAFLKNVLDSTNDEVIVNIGGKRLNTNTVARGYGKPGVGPAVLSILSLDSSNLATSINEFYKGTDYASIIPVHDAAVFGVGDYGFAKQYSNDFYSINKRYSIAEEFMNAIIALENRPGSKVNEMSIRTKVGVVSFAAMKSNLENQVNQIREGRSKLYSKKLKVGQMVLSDGTMYTADPEQEKVEAIKYIKGLAERINNLMSHYEVKQALGFAEYKKHKQLLTSMLEGCK